MKGFRIMAREEKDELRMRGQSSKNRGAMNWKGVVSGLFWKSAKG
jgi:hypothetical protein